MSALKPVIETLKIANTYRNEILGGVCLITSIVLLVLAIQHVHLSQVSLNWCRFTPQVLAPLNLPITIILFGFSGALVGAGIFFLKNAIVKRVEKKIEQKVLKVHPFVAKTLRELHFAYCILLFISIIAGIILVVYGSHYLATLHKVFNLSQQHNFYLVGLLDKGHGVEWAFTMIAGGVALGSSAILESTKKWIFKVSNLINGRI